MKKLSKEKIIKEATEAYKFAKESEFEEIVIALYTKEEKYRIKEEKEGFYCIETDDKCEKFWEVLEKVLNKIEEDVLEIEIE